MYKISFCIIYISLLDAFFNMIYISKFLIFINRKTFIFIVLFISNIEIIQIYN